VSEIFVLFCYDKCFLLRHDDKKTRQVCSAFIPVVQTSNKDCSSVDNLSLLSETVCMDLIKHCNLKALSMNCK
jgi:hypothetical protein